MILPKRFVRVLAAVLAIWSTLVFICSILHSVRIVHCSKTVKTYDEERRPWCSSFSFENYLILLLPALILLSVFSLVQFPSSIALFRAISKEKKSSIQEWRGVNMILTALVTNVPMVAAMMCFLSAEENGVVSFWGACAIASGLIHAGLAAVLTVNLKFHYEDDSEDSCEPTNPDPVVLTETQLGNALEMPQTGVATTAF